MPGDGEVSYLIIHWGVGGGGRSPPWYLARMDCVNMEKNWGTFWILK